MMANIDGRGVGGESASMFATLSPTTATTMAGGFAGAVCATVCSPLDVTKTRMQAQGGLDIARARAAKVAGLPAPKLKYTHGVFAACRTILREEGPAGWFRGYSTAIVTVPIFWSFYFPIYTELKGVYARSIYDSRGGEGAVGEAESIAASGSEGPLVHALAAATAGACVDVLTNPLWVIRTRLQTQWLYRTVAEQGGATAATAIAQQEGRPRLMYDGMFDAARKMLRHEGVGSFYKGLSASLLGCSHVAVQFPVYEELRAQLRARRLMASANAHESGGGGSSSTHADAEELSTVEILIASTTSKLVASTATYPHEVVRTRLQDQQTVSNRGCSAAAMSSATKGWQPTSQYLGLVDCMRSIVREEGVEGLYRGLSVNIIRAAPACAITFVSFEHVKSWLFAQRESAELRREQ